MSNKDFNREEAISYIMSVFSCLSKDEQQAMLKVINSSSEDSYSCEAKNFA